MKISILIAEGDKQIMLTPENDHEREALKYIAPDDELEVVPKMATFDDKPRHAGMQVSMSQGGNYRRYAVEDSLMFVIKNKTKK